MADEQTRNIVIADPWTDLRQITDARIALGRTGSSLPLAASLAFKLDHARARDAVHTPFRMGELAAGVRADGLDCVELESAVADRNEYLTRPDKGRSLSASSRTALAECQAGGDVCLVVGDGLSARAIHENAREFVLLASTLLRQAGLAVTPVCLVRNARVAIGDEIGALLGAKMVVVLIGERPGLSSPNSMGVYMTMNPYIGATDERRNCISNVRAGGLSIIEGVRKLGYLVEESLKLGMSGVALKDRMAAGHLPFGVALENRNYSPRVS